MPRVAPRHVIAVLAVSALLGACAGSNPASPSEGPMAAAKGAGGTTTPAFYTGTWVQSPPTRTILTGQGASGTDTLFTDLTLKMLLTQSGTKLSGSVHRYITTWDNHGVFLYVDVDAGTPGKLTGTVGASGISVSVRDLGETKISAVWVFTLSADGHTLANQGAGPAAFIR